MSFCSYFDRAQCRSCTWMGQDYALQLERKEALVQEALSFLPRFQLEPTFASQEQGFRNRAKMSVTGSLEQPIIGLVGEGSLDDGRELLACPIHHPKLNELMGVIPDFIRLAKIEPYQIARRTGELKGLIAFYSPVSAQMYLRFVLRSQECIARLKKTLPSLQQAFPELVCVSANLQPIPHAILEGPEEVFLTEARVIEHTVGAVTLRLAPQAFVQTNSAVATALYQTAAQWIGEAQVSKMLELFCGQGAFSFLAARSVKEALGIEINADAVKTANETARSLGLSHLTFKQSDATRVDAELETYRPELLLVNPPRRGLAEGVRSIERALSSQLIYSSCSIETLAKDLRCLAAHYRLKRARIFDMFPHTEHFEILVWLER